MKISKLLITYSFLICLCLMLAGILSAKTASQLINGFIYLPLVLYFGLTLIKVSRKTTKKKDLETAKPAQILPPKMEPIPENVPDQNKRLFLRLLGTSSLSLLLMALFTKKAQASFFGSAPIGPSIVGLKDTTGAQINPAEKLPTDGYEISEINDTGTYAYYGFVKKSGEWYILKDTSGAFRYAKGSTGFSTNWTNRASLTYDYFSNVFG